MTTSAAHPTPLKATEVRAIAEDCERRLWSINTLLLVEQVGPERFALVFTDPNGAMWMQFAEFCR